jgi:hypothetical protein
MNGMPCSHLRQHPVELGDVHVPLEGDVRCGIVRLIDHTVHRDPAVVFDVRLGGVEVDVVGNVVAFLDHGGEQQVLGHASLVRRDHVLVPGDAPYRLLEAEVVVAPGVRLVAHHQCRPLLIRHRGRAGVGEQVDRDEPRGNAEDVVARLRERRFPLGARGEGDRLDGLDLERFHWSSGLRCGGRYGSCAAPGRRRATAGGLGA